MCIKECTKEKLVVETDKGTYTIPFDEAPGRCAAEERCLEMGGILAPITDKTDLNAIVNGIQSCEYQSTKTGHAKYVGLSISKDNSHRIFSNGVHFNKDLHGDLYEENNIRPGNCPGAFLTLYYPERIQIGQVWGCHKNLEKQYICFKSKNAAISEAVKGDLMSYNSNLLIFGGLCLVALVCLVGFLLIKVKKQASKISQLTSSVA